MQYRTRRGIVMIDSGNSKLVRVDPLKRTAETKPHLHNTSQNKHRVLLRPANVMSHAAHKGTYLIFGSGLQRSLEVNDALATFKVQTKFGVYSNTDRKCIPVSS